MSEKEGNVSYTNVFMVPDNDYENVVKIKDFICCYVVKTARTTSFQGYITLGIPLEMIMGIETSEKRNKQRRLKHMDDIRDVPLVFSKLLNV